MDGRRVLDTLRSISHMANANRVLSSGVQEPSPDREPVEQEAPRKSRKEDSCLTQRKITAAAAAAALEHTWTSHRHRKYIEKIPRTFLSQRRANPQEHTAASPQRMPSALGPIPFGKDRRSSGRPPARPPARRGEMKRRRESMKTNMPRRITAEGHGNRLPEGREPEGVVAAASRFSARISTAEVDDDSPRLGARLAPERWPGGDRGCAGFRVPAAPRLAYRRWEVRAAGGGRTFALAPAGLACTASGPKKRRTRQGRESARHGGSAKCWERGEKDCWMDELWGLCLWLDSEGGREGGEGPNLDVEVAEL
ncbi:hypothetical protein AXG93_2090s1220 [Marchantia polymorpha subsp. ruderalis]|uniref:Uncharacterized protein n=1 Tax=Marchantia polymorpha subsp. ruderalis TaxID=1480154 RepID=A0A176WB17_MARPO|nr:hypothetical protein AXG93_2090s1220 [Marchantia polymorpha subsp. ruderalis]